MKRPSPLMQMTMALVGMCGTLLLLADLFFGVLPDHGAQSQQLRRGISEALAVQVAELLQSDDRATLQRTLDRVAERTGGVASLAIRRTDGTLAIQAGDHLRHWHSTSDSAQSDPEQVVVPLYAGGAPWGRFEVAFRPEEGGFAHRLLRQPLVITLLFVAGAGTVAFWLYMRRALQHLDPSSVIPKRVRGAYDAMAEGVVVLDARGRMMLANQAFQALWQQAGGAEMGKHLTSLPRLIQALPADPQAHPWTRAMSLRESVSGHTLVMDDAEGNAHHLVVNCAPITDVGGKVRGCMVTFNDVSDLHRANQALRDSMDELQASRDEVQRQNLELERLATRDPLTNCLNRRAFNEAFAAVFEAARRGAQPLSCVMVDIDHFKAINDRHGHAIGDRAIQEVAKRLLSSARSVDLVCRYGGEEFCVVIPGADGAEASAFAERLRQGIEREAGPGVRELPDLRITASLGVASLRPGVAHGAALVDRADQALYTAKRAGRNQVQAFAEPDPTPDGERDPVSGLLTAEAFREAFAALLAGIEPRDTPLAVLKLAVDPYADRLEAAGQAAADGALRQVADRLKAMARPGDLLGRLGDEHLAIVMPGLSLLAALDVAEGLRQRVQAGGAGDVPTLTVSVGVDVLPAQASGAPTLLDRADRALSRARRAGRNSVRGFAAETRIESTGEASTVDVGRRSRA